MFGADIRSFLIKPQKAVLAEAKSKRRETIQANENEFDELLQPLPRAKGPPQVTARRTAGDLSDEDDDSLVFQSPPPPDQSSAARSDETAGPSPANLADRSLFDTHTEVICEDAFEQELRDAQAAAAKHKAAAIDVQGVGWTPSVAPAPLPQPAAAPKPAELPERRISTLAERRAAREAARVARREQRKLGGFIVYSDDESDSDAEDLKEQLSVELAEAPAGAVSSTEPAEEAEDTPTAPLTLASFFQKNTPATAAKPAKRAPSPVSLSDDPSSSDGSDEDAAAEGFKYAVGDEVYMKFSNDSPRARSEEWCGVIETVDPLSGAMQIYFEEDGDVIRGVKQDDSGLRKQISEKMDEHSSSESEESESDSSSESDSESDDEQHEQVAERRSRGSIEMHRSPPASAGARLGGGPIGVSPQERAERLSFILANSPALLKRKQDELDKSTKRHNRRARIADAVVKTAVEGGLRRVPDELKKLQAANYGSISSRAPTLFSQQEENDDDLSIDDEVEAGPAGSTEPDVSEETVLARMMVVKRAKLRVASARDSTNCGHLSVGTVVDVLEKVVLGKELLLDESEEGGSASAADEGVNVRVRCKGGWLSVTSSSGNTLLESLQPDGSTGSAEQQATAESTEDGLVGEGDVESWSDLWPSSHANSPQIQRGSTGSAGSDSVEQRKTKKRTQPDGPNSVHQGRGSPRFPRYAKALKKQEARASFASLYDDADQEQEHEDEEDEEDEEDSGVFVEAGAVESEDEDEDGGRRSSQRLAGKRDAPDGSTEPAGPSARASRAKRRRGSTGSNSVAGGR